MASAKTAAPPAEKNGKWYPPLPIWTAADLMTANPASIRGQAAVSDAAAFLDKRGITAAPVIDEAGRPIGVISRTDIVHHARGGGHRTWSAGYYQDASLASPAGSADGAERIAGDVGSAPVASIMTPLVYSVPLTATAGEIVDAMVGCKVHRLFVTDAGGVVVGVISAMDVLVKLRG